MLFLGSDHAGWDLKENLKKILLEKKIPFEDLSSPQFDRNDDYPDIAFQVAQKVSSTEKGRAILICGSGTGISIAANKVSGIRAASLRTPTEVALARLHNDLNILCLPGLEFPLQIEEELQKGQYKDLLALKPSVRSAEKAFELVQVFLNTPFDGGRHQRRLDKILHYEKKE